MNEIKLINNGNEYRASSLEIAMNFKKEHAKVTRDIEKLISEITPKMATSYFIANIYKDSMNRSQTEYLMTRDGFSLLVMGFTGKKALQWKLKYIDAFNKMEQALKEVRVESYTIEDPIARAQAWIREQQEKKEVELKLIHTSKILDEVVNNNITFDAFNKELSKIINTISRHVGTDSGYIYGSFYSFINSKLGINLTTRQTHKKRKLNEEYYARTGRYYKDSTLKTKVSKLSCIKVSEYEQVLEVAKSFAVDNGVDITNYNKLTIKTA